MSQCFVFLVSLRLKVMHNVKAYRCVVHMFDVIQHHARQSTGTFWIHGYLGVSEIQVWS